MNKIRKKNVAYQHRECRCAVATDYGSEVVKSVFQRYGAHGTYDLSPCYYSEVFADLELIANDN